VQAQVAEWFGESPANPKACALTSDKTFCDTFKTTDDAFNSQLYYWTTPTEECLDGRTVKCVPFTEWQKAWTEIKG
jgi:putative spermidine/putrescine transport system substrate-binding protein